jgi:hypothetical protein
VGAPNECIPDEVLFRPDLLTALAGHDFATAFTLIKRHAGISQNRMAAACDIKPSRVGDIIRGRSEVTTIEKIERIADGLRIPGRLLRLAPRPWEAGRPAAAPPAPGAGPVAPPPGGHRTSTGDGSAPSPVVRRRPPGAENVMTAWAMASTAEMIVHVTRRDLTVDRRDATRALVGLAVGPALLEPLARWLARGTEPRPRGTGTPTIGLHEVEEIERTAAAFRSWDDQFGGGLRRKAVLGQLSEVGDLLRTTQPPAVTRRLFGATAQLSETVAMMSWDSGQAASAQRYYLLAVRAAKSGGDRGFGANIMAGMARQLLYLERSSDALALVKLARESASGQPSSRVLAMLSTREAWCYAHQGRMAAFRQATERAEAELEASNPEDDPYWIRYFDAAELAGVTGGRLLEHARIDRRVAAEAAMYIERAIRLRGEGHLRSSALDRLGLAEARLLQGELDEAARTGQTAVDVVEQTRSDRVRVQLADLHSRLTRHPHRAAPPLIDLRDRTAAALAS